MQQPDANTNTIDIWDVDLVTGAHIDWGDFASILSDDELRQARQFKFASDRHRYCVTRLVLRSLLAHYTMQAPQSIRFSYGRYGKPQIMFDDPQHDIRFNVSHTHTRALFAFTRNDDVGIDIEHVRQGFSVLDIARSHYRDTEHALLTRSPEHERQSLFFDIWVRKEAVVKAMGYGMSLDFKAFDVLPIPISRLNVQYEWRACAVALQQLDIGNDFAAAVAVVGEHMHQLRHMRASVQDIIESCSGEHSLPGTQFGALEPIQSLAPYLI